MSSLREVKDRIASVRSTLKITSAMKLVASSKLRKAQRAIEALRPYSEALEAILAAVQRSDTGGFGGSAPRPLGVQGDSSRPLMERSDMSRLEGQSAPRPLGVQGDSSRPLMERSDMSRAVVIAIASNSSMCGAFNVNAAKRALELLDSAEGETELWTFGRKVADILRKEGHPADRDFTRLVAHPSFEAVAELSAELMGRYASGEISCVMLVYNHFVSAGRQEVVVEPFIGSAVILNERSEVKNLNSPDLLYIIEPSSAELTELLYPQILNLKLYSAILDSAAAEHAARMVAMQAATDNAEELLGELTLEYNKGRQHKITSEILDIVGGSME